MSYPLIIRPAAEDDIAEARDWYAEQRDGLGAEFLLAVDQAFEHIREWPEMYAADYKGVRRSGMNRFLYVSTTASLLYR